MCCFLIVEYNNDIECEEVYASTMNNNNSFELVCDRVYLAMIVISLRKQQEFMSYYLCSITTLQSAHDFNQYEEHTDILNGYGNLIVWLNSTLMKQMMTS